MISAIFVLIAFCVTLVLGLLSLWAAFCALATGGMDNLSPLIVWIAFIGAIILWMR